MIRNRWVGAEDDESHSWFDHVFSEHLPGNRLMHTAESREAS